MKTFDLTLVISGVDPDSPDFESRFFDAGCDDATISVQKGSIILEFHREAKNFAHALSTAIRDVEKVGARVERVEPDHLVSLSDIAARVGISRSAVSLYSMGTRGKGFPAPIARVSTDSPLWDWVEVSRWMYQHRKLSLQAVVEAKIVRRANRAVVVGRDAPIARQVVNA